MLLVGGEVDEHLDLVEEHLAHRDVTTVRIARDASGALADWERASQCRAVLCRTGAPYGAVAHHAERCARVQAERLERPAAVDRFVSEQQGEALIGHLAGLEARVWINHPNASARAENKQVQLRAAARAGLRVPRTVVSDEPSAIRAFADDVGAIVVKSLGSPFVWEDGDRAGFLYTSIVPQSLLDELDEREPVTGLFQERLVARTELRVTIVADRCFAARTYMEPGALDWRRGLTNGVPFEAVRLQPGIESAVLDVVRGLGLAFAAVDLLETDDDIFFLELNPAGAYGWLERRLGFPITECICDALVHNAD